MSKEILSLANLPRAQILYIHEMLKIVIICKNKNLIFAVF